MSIVDRAYLMFHGELLKSGTPQELIADKKVREVYLGENFVLKNIF